MRRHCMSRLEKPVKQKNQDFLNFIKTLPCLVCRAVPSDPDHITTRGAGGGDYPENVWPLCRAHHNERHAIGIKSLVEKYPSLEDWLRRAGRTDVLSKLGLEEQSLDKEWRAR